MNAWLVRDGRLVTWSKGICRGILAFVFTVYSVAKWTGAQFTVFGMTLDKPVCELSGTELTWTFFGYSQTYAAFIALGQLVAAFLLTFNRTARLGAAILLPITANIMMVNFGFHFDSDTRILSVFLLVINLYLLILDFPAWKRFFWDETASPYPARKLAGLPVPEVVKGLLMTLLLLSVTWFLMHVIERQYEQTALVGDWQVESARMNGIPASDPAIGGEWRWMSFDPFGYMTVRTNRWTFIGKYTAPQGKEQFTANYDPIPLPPLLPGENLPHPRISQQDEARLVNYNLPDYHWPISVKGTIHGSGKKIIIHVQKDKDEIEWVLRPFVRPKW